MNGNAPQKVYQNPHLLQYKTRCLYGQKKFFFRSSIKLPKLSIIIAMQYSSFYPRHPHLLYAENCPEEPLILNSSGPNTPKRKKKFPQKQHPKQNNLNYQPRIIMSHKKRQQRHQINEHGRELASLYYRIKNCKSLPQRKKDHNDPIVYPAYFVRQQIESKDARIDGYFRQIVSNRPKKKKNSNHSSKNKKSVSQQQEQYSFRSAEMLTTRMPLPVISNRLEVFLEENILKLPDCNSKSVLNYIEQQQIYLSRDKDILKARMAHYYGQQRVLQLWQQLPLLQSNRFG